MGKIFCLMGKSSTGKDTVYQKLFLKNNLNLHKIVPYTTRPIREGEVNGREYFFCTEDKVQELTDQNKIVELRAYDTVYGIWKYFTVDDGQICLEQYNYLLIGTLETYLKIRDFYGEENVIPIYIEVEDGERLLRAIGREKEQKSPMYTEMCRRFIADSEDFAEEKLQAAGIRKRFENKKIDDTVEAVTAYILENM